MNKIKVAKSLIKIAKELIGEQVINEDKLDKQILMKLKKNFDKVQQTRYSNDFWFYYKNNECSLSYTNNFREFYYFFNVDMTDGKHIHISRFNDTNLDNIIKEIKNTIDNYKSDNLTKNIKNKVQRIFKNWRFERIQKEGEYIVVYLSKKAYGDGYNAYCIVKNGRIVETDDYNSLRSETEKLLKQIDVKNIRIYGESD